MSTKQPPVRPSALRSPGSSTSTNLRVKVNKQFLKPSKTNPDKEIKDPKGTKRKAEVVENDSKGDRKKTKVEKEKELQQKQKEKEAKEKQKALQKEKRNEGEGERIEGEGAQEEAEGEGEGERTPEEAEREGDEG